MIRNIELTNFKCFDQISLNTGMLTIIAGGNAAGKSSVIQSLLLLSQSKHDVADGRLRLADKLVNLVSSDHILYKKSKTPDIKITVYDDHDSLEDDFEVTIPDAMIADRQPACLTSANMQNALINTALFADDFLYLNANRLTPQIEYLKGNDEKFDSRLGDRTGHRTVFRLQEAFDNMEEVAIEGLKRNGKSGIEENVNEWISYIMDTKISVSADGNPSDGKARLLFNTPSTGSVSALNMAFGNTYILPIIVGVLTARPGSLMIVENPEAHLHPKAQLRIGEFLSIAAQGGVQIFVETHSDHLLNGIRVATRKNLIDPYNVAILFIEEENGGHFMTEIELKKDGTLDKWPSGFFDEWENALREITSPQ